jgi:hypothetical protein
MYKNYLAICQDVTLREENPFIAVGQLFVPRYTRWNPDDKVVLLEIEDSLRLLSLNEIKVDPYLKDVLHDLADEILFATSDLGLPLQNADDMEEFLHK